MNKAADADMAGQGYSHLAMMRTRVRSTKNDTFMLKSGCGCIPTGVSIEGSWRGALTANKIY